MVPENQLPLSLQELRNILFQTLHDSAVIEALDYAEDWKAAQRMAEVLAQRIRGLVR